MRGERQVKLRAVLALFAILACGALALPPGSSAAHAGSARAASFPRSFVGMNGDGPLFSSHVNLQSQLDRMVASGVGRLRVLFSWAVAQPYASWAQVPAGREQDFVPAPNGVPTDFRFTDHVVELAAKHGLPVLPVVKYAPSWDASSTNRNGGPARNGPFGAYLTALVARYGRQGSFWTNHPSLPHTPITSWQVWNEPDLGWGSSWPAEYVALLRVAHHDVNRADPHAKIILAALTNYSWQDLASIYKIPGARGLFGVASFNSYTAQPQGVITILDRDRAVMKQYGDGGKPMIATEIGWPSALGKTPFNPGFETTEQGQARKLQQVLPLLASNRKRLGIMSFYYYTWMGTDLGNNPFHYSGLLHFHGGHIYAKPAYAAFNKTVLKLER